jgi:hypothetical protein
MARAACTPILQVEGVVRRLRLVALAVAGFLPLIVSCDDERQQSTGCEPLNLPALSEPIPTPPPTGAQRAQVWPCVYGVGSDSVFGHGGEIVWSVRLGARREVQLEGYDAGRVTSAEWRSTAPEIFEISALSPTHARLSTRGLGKVPPPSVRVCGFGDGSCLTLETMRVVPPIFDDCSRRGFFIDRIEVVTRGGQ